eukprot:PhF_6_TR41070/c0_g1_i1/m.62212
MFLRICFCLILCIVVVQADDVDCPPKPVVARVHSWALRAEKQYAPSLLRFYTSTLHMSRFLNITFKENATKGGHACEKVCDMLSEPTWKGYVDRYTELTQQFKDTIETLGDFSVSFTDTPLPPLTAKLVQDVYETSEYTLTYHMHVSRASTNALHECPGVRKGNGRSCPMSLELKAAMATLVRYTNAASAQKEMLMLADALRQYDHCLEKDEL